MVLIEPVKHNDGRVQPAASPQLRRRDSRSGSRSSSRQSRRPSAQKRLPRRMSAASDRRGSVLSPPALDSDTDYSTDDESMPRRASAKRRFEDPPLAGRCESSQRHIHPVRLKIPLPTDTEETRNRVTTRKVSAVTLRLMDTQPRSIAAVQQSADELKRLDMSGLGIRNLRESWFQQLTCLTRLDVSHNRLGDNSVPESLRSLDNLMEVLAFGNRFTVVPVGIRRLRNIRRLNLSQNKIDSLAGLDKARRLQALVIDDNHLQSCIKEVCSLKRLELLHCSRNQIKDITSDIRHLKTLSDFRFSGNRVHSLPPELFLLPALDVLDASCNLLTRLPSMNIKGRTKRKLASIDLSDNNLIKFPEFLLLLTEKLDVSANRIKTIQGHIIRKIAWEEDVSLSIYDNPITSPPPEIAVSGFRALLHYFVDEMSTTKVYQGQKIVIMGSEGSGKTSLVQSLVDEQPRPATEMTHVLEVHEFAHDVTTSEGEVAPLMLTLFDLAGHEMYRQPITAFIEQPALALFVFDMANFSEETFYEKIGTWIHLFIAKTNSLTGILVGTHTDKLTEKEVDDISGKAMNCLRMHLAKIKRDTQEEMKAIEDTKNIPLSMQEQLKRLVAVLRMKPHIYEEVIPISSTEYTGFGDLVKAMEDMCLRRGVFPNCMRIIPSLWLEVEQYLEGRGGSAPDPVMLWQDFLSEVSRKIGLKHLLPQIAQYMHDSGKLFLCPAGRTDDEPALLILRPTYLVDILQQIYRADLQDVDYNHVDAFKLLGISQARFDLAREEFRRDGYVDREFMKALLANTVAPEYGTALNNVLLFLSSKYELMYSSDLVNPNASASRYQMPWFRKVPEPERAQNDWQELEDAPGLSMLFQFHRFYPDGLFERWVVKMARHKELRFKSHWTGGVRAFDPTRKIHILARLQLSPSTAASAIFLSARDEGLDEPDPQPEQDENENPLEDASLDDSRKCHRRLWACTLPLIQYIEDIIHEFKGLCIQRFTGCPSCREFSFHGEWLTPKDFQSTPSRSCEACHELQSTEYLVQPKDRHKVDVMKLLARRKAAEERKLREAPDGTVSDRTSSVKPDSGSEPTINGLQQSHQKLKAPNGKRQINLDSHKVIAKPGDLANVVSLHKRSDSNASHGSGRSRSSTIERKPSTSSRRDSAGRRVILDVP